MKILLRLLLLAAIAWCATWLILNFLSETRSPETVSLSLAEESMMAIRSPSPLPPAANRWVPTLPPGMELVKVIATDSRISKSGEVQRRAIVEITGSLGRLLVLERESEKGSITYEYYSARHCLINPENRLIFDLDAGQKGLSQRGLQVMRPNDDFPGFYLPFLGQTPEAIFAELDDAKGKVGKDWVVELDGVGRGAGGTTEYIDIAKQWHHGKIQTPGAWALTTGDSKVVVAILDTGVSTREFNSRFHYSGYDYVQNVSAQEDDHGHGTAVASVLAEGHSWNSSGIDWNCKLLPIKVMDENNYGLYSWWTSGIYYAVRNGARVINLSAGGTTTSGSLTAAIDYAIENRCIFVTIAGNDSSPHVKFPGSMSQCITIGATERDDTLTEFTNYGASVDLLAPGRDISTSKLTELHGTSFAAPQVSGAISLLLSVDPEYDQSSIEKALEISGDPVPQNRLPEPRKRLNISKLLGVQERVLNLSELEVQYDGTPKPILVKTNPDGIPVVVTYNGGKTPPTLPGVYLVKAVSKDARYPAKVEVELNVLQSEQTVEFVNLPIGPITYNSKYPLFATASIEPVTFEVASGNAKIINNNILHITGGGEIRVIARQAGNEIYYAGYDSAIFQVEKRAQRISFPPFPQRVEFSKNPLKLSASSTSGLGVSFSVVEGSASILNGQLTMHAPGRVKVRAFQSGDFQFSSAAPVERILNIVDQTPPTVKARKLEIFTTQVSNRIHFRFHDNHAIYYAKYRLRLPNKKYLAWHRISPFTSGTTPIVLNLKQPGEYVMEVLAVDEAKNISLTKRVFITKL